MTHAAPYGCESARDLIDTLGKLVATAREAGLEPTDCLIPTEAKTLIDAATPEEQAELQVLRFGPPPPLQGYIYQLMGLRVSWRIGATSVAVGDHRLPTQLLREGGYPETFAAEVKARRDPSDVLANVRQLAHDFERKFRNTPDTARLTRADQEALRDLGFSLPNGDSRIHRICGLDITSGATTSVGNLAADQWLPDPRDAEDAPRFAAAAVRVIAAGLAKEARGWIAHGLRQHISNIPAQEDSTLRARQALLAEIEQNP